MIWLPLKPGSPQPRSSAMHRIMLGCPTSAAAAAGTAASVPRKVLLLTKIPVPPVPELTMFSQARRLRRDAASKVEPDGSILTQLQAADNTHAIIRRDPMVRY